MAIAISLKTYLDSRGVPFDVLPHMRTAHALSSARAVGVPADEMAKGVLMKHPNGYVLAIVPASREVNTDVLSAYMERPLDLASEDEVAEIFEDCDTGAIPPMSKAYGIEGVIDEALDNAHDIYFEGGDHRSLIHISGRDFTEMMAEVPHAAISAPRR